jgi:hypothetical protein
MKWLNQMTLISLHFQHSASCLILQLFHCCSKYQNVVLISHWPRFSFVADKIQLLQRYSCYRYHTAQNQKVIVLTFPQISVIPKIFFKNILKLYSLYFYIKPFYWKSINSVWALCQMRISSIGQYQYWLRSVTFSVDTPTLKFHDSDMKHTDGHNFPIMSSSHMLL